MIVCAVLVSFSQCLNVPDFLDGKLRDPMYF